jgi:phage gp36-like protein
VSYATKQNMIDRFDQAELIQLTDKGLPATGAIVDAVLNSALADADAEIDGYLVGAYQLPLQSVPKNLTTIACDIARYKLYDDRATEHVRLRYEDAIKYLVRVGKGELSLGLDSANQPAPASSAPMVSGPARTFDADTLNDYTR